MNKKGNLLTVITEVIGSLIAIGIIIFILAGFIGPKPDSPINVVDDIPGGLLDDVEDKINSPSNDDVIDSATSSLALDVTPYAPGSYRTIGEIDSEDIVLAEVHVTYNNLANLRLDNGLTALEHLDTVSQNKGIDPILFTSLVVQESKGVWNAVSHTGAAGLAQFSGPTANDENLPYHTIFEDKLTYCCTAESARLGRCHKSPYTLCNQDNDNRFNPRLSLEAGAEYLKRAGADYNNDFVLTLTMYNAGEGPANACKSFIGNHGKAYACVLDNAKPASKKEELRKYIKRIATNYNEFRRIIEENEP